MRCDCHIHMVLDGKNWRCAIASHTNAPAEWIIRNQLEIYRAAGFRYLRDGGDRWGVGECARRLAPEYGIRLVTPLAPIHRSGHYGGFIGEGFDDLRDYANLVRKRKRQGADFIKVMISGLMDFDRPGLLTEPGLPPEEIREMVHIAHSEGFSVMAHANGARTVEAAAEAGVDSVEHGAYLDADALAAMKEMGTVWVPTLSTIGNLRGTGRFQEASVREILATAADNVRNFADMGGLLAPGTDAGAWAVPHGSLTEYTLLQDILGDHAETFLRQGAEAIQSKF